MAPEYDYYVEADMDQQSLDVSIGLTFNKHVKLYLQQA